MNKLFEKFPWLNNVRTLTFIFVAIVLAATIHRLWLGNQSFNNFTIFRFSFYNLIHGNDLYILHPDQYNDLYKYSPTFAFLMAPFYVMPSWLGIFVFNLLNALLPIWAINRLNISSKAKSFFILFIAIELLSSIQNAQSNGIMTGLIIAAFSSFERKEVVLAALFICLGFYLKVFAAVAGILFLFYDKKLKFIISAAIIGIGLALLPIVVTGSTDLIFQYTSWFHLLANDPVHELNFSFMTLTQRWFNFTCSDAYYLIPGMLLLLLPLVRMQEWKNFSFRLVYLATILIWVVIFNHKAESPTFVIAVSGIAIWAMTEENKLLRIFMLWFVFVFTILSPTDLFPHVIKETIWIPYCLKVLPCIVAWIKITWRLLTKKYSTETELMFK